MYTKEKVSKALKEIGYQPQIEIGSYLGLPSIPTIVKLFKKTKMSEVWSELDIPFIPPPSYTKEEVGEALKKTGYLKIKEIEQHPNLPACTTVLRLFKTSKMTNVWKELDIPMPNFYTKEEISKGLKKIGHLSSIEIDKHPDLPSCSTVLRLFKTTKINDAWRELSIDVPDEKKQKPKRLN